MEAELIVYSWGGRSYALFHNSMDDQPFPKRIEDYDEKFNMTTFQILLNGVGIVFDYGEHIYTFGKALRDPHGEEECREPKKIEKFENEKIVEICGSYGVHDSHTLFLNKRMEVFGCGTNANWQAAGKAGLGSMILTPMLVTQTGPISHITCGYRFSGAISQWKTKILSWGYNRFGTLGNGSSFVDLRVSGPEEVKGLIDKDCRVEMLGMGVRHSMAMTTSVKDSLNRRVWVWGGAYLGQAGNGSRDLEDHPCASEVKYFAEEGIPIKKIACGAFCCAVLTANGEALLWGSNSIGCCGVGEKNTKWVLIPTKIHFLAEGSPMSELVCLDITCSRDHSLALCADVASNDNRRVCFSWGSKYRGELGRGDVLPEDIYAPKEILFFRGLEEDYAVTRIGVGYVSSYCFVEKLSKFHLDDQDVQDEKLELLFQLAILWVVHEQ